MTDQNSLPRKDIKLIAVDLDGTLLNSKHELTPRTIKALKAAMAKGVKVILATGKTRRANEKFIEELGLQDTPSICVQGLVVHNGDGSIRYQQTLEPKVLRQVVTFAEERGFTILAYSGQRVLVRSHNRDCEEIEHYHEPRAEEVGSLQNLIDNTPINKLMAVKLGEAKRVKALRWQLDMQINGAARLMQSALADMLEILPPGASKGTALRHLLKDLNISASQVIAFGDAENDLEMIKLAGIGFAMGNADAALKAAADQVVGSNDEDGVAEAIERFILGPEPKPEPAAPVSETPISREEGAPVITTAPEAAATTVTSTPQETKADAE
ncbi:MAG: HAD family hydrolase [Burkholderiales bacterium]|nr:HAD family hydrolase [Anaerolineae bacterium]